MSAYVLDSIDPLPLQHFSGFDLPDDVTAVAILGDGSSAFNAVLQSAGTRLPEAQISGRTVDATLISDLRALRLSEAPVTFTEELGSHTVALTKLSVTKSASIYFLWDWSATLVELPWAGS